MTPKDWVEIVQYVSVIAASAAAIFGIQSWHSEFVGKRRIELAEDALALFYEAKDIIRNIRSPFGLYGEGQTRQPGPTERPEDKAALDTAYVLIERYGKHREFFSRIQALGYRFMATFGKEAAAPFGELTTVVNQLIGSAYTMARLSTRTRHFRSQVEAEKYHEMLRENEKVYYSGDDDDPIAPKVDELVSNLERTCQAVITNRGKLSQP